MDENDSTSDYLLDLPLEDAPEFYKVDVANILDIYAIPARDEFEPIPEVWMFKLFFLVERENGELSKEALFTVDGVEHRVRRTQELDDQLQSANLEMQRRKDNMLRGRREWAF